MSIWDLADTIGIESKISNLSGSKFFFGILCSNYKNNQNEKYAWSKPLSQDRLKKFEKTNKEILAKTEDTILYRIAGRLYVNKLFNNNWQGKMIFGN